MTRVWYLRDEFYRALHQWPIMMVFVILGCLAGWGASYVWPGYYRAAAQIYVGINPYRALQDARFLAVSRPKYSNVDDYKNWQMSQLEAAVFLEEVLRETLVDLQASDVYWQDLDTADLRSMLDTDWRSAGEWSLVAKHPEALRAEQLSAAWSKVAQRQSLERDRGGTRNTLMVDQEAQAVAAQLVKTQLRREQLESALNQLEAWQQSALELPAEEPVPGGMEWQLRSLASQLADFSPAWTQTLNAQPPPGSLAAAYIEWSNQVGAQIENELPTLIEQIGVLEQQRASLREQYSFESDNSLGLSPTLEILGLKNHPAQPVRPSATMILVGGMIGLLGWLLFQVIRISLLRSGQKAVTPQPEKPLS